MRLKNIYTIKCEKCGHELWIMDSLTNECDICHALYNGFGQRLKDGVDSINHPCHDGGIY